MKKTLLIGILFLLSIKIFGQINVKDSTVQAIGYWSKLEMQSYDISFEKLKIKKSDTISRELINYEVDVKIIDSTENSYVTKWHYKNFKIDTKNELVKKLTSLTNDISVLIKTDEFGAFIEVVNWEEVRDFLSKVSVELKQELKNIPNSEKIINNLMSIYATKTSVEANAIKDAIQFYAFYGVKYKLGEELEGNIQVANNFGGKPFDTYVKFSLDEINSEEGNSVVRMKQVVNSEQLTNETFNYLIKSGAFGNKIPKRKDFPALTNEIYTASRIHGETGWIIYSIETKEVKAEETTNIEERIIEIK